MTDSTGAADEGIAQRVAGALATFTSALASVTSVDEVLTEYLKRVRTVIPARGVGIYLSRGAGKPPRAAADGVSEYYLELYEEVGRTIDPVLRCVMESGEPRSSSQVMSAEEWQATEFYQRVLSVHGFQSTLKAPIVSEGRIIGTLNMGAREPEAFGEADLAIAGALGHVVGLAVALATKLEDAAREGDQLSQGFECSEDALVISDLRTGARRPNAAARRILGLLSADEEELFLEDLLAVNQPGRTSKRQSIRIHGTGQEILLQTLGPGQDRKLLIARLELRSDGDLPVAPHAQALLSPREWQVAAAVSLGLHDQQIAENLVLSVHTVKQHLKSIYKKIGVNSRVELTRVVLMRRGAQGGGSDAGLED